MVLRLFAIAGLMLSAPEAAADPAPPIQIERSGLFVVADDLERSLAFYEKLFGKPQFRLPKMIGFDVAGGLYAVVDRKTYAAKAVRGDTVRGYIKVANIAAAHRHAAAIAPRMADAAVTTEGRFSFFRVRDPDGNIMEFYAVSP